MDMSQIGNMVNMLNSMGGLDINNILGSAKSCDKDGCDSGCSKGSSSIFLVILIILLVCSRRRGIGFGRGSGFGGKQCCLDDCCCLCKKKDRKRCRKLKKKIAKQKCRCCGQCECCDECECCGSCSSCGSGRSCGCGRGGYGGYGGYGGCGGFGGSGIGIIIFFLIFIFKCFCAGNKGLNSIFDSLQKNDDCNSCLN